MTETINFSDIDTLDLIPRRRLVEAEEAHLKTVKEHLEILNEYLSLLEKQENIRISRNAHMKSQEDAIVEKRKES